MKKTITYCIQHNIDFYKRWLTINEIWLLFQCIEIILYISDIFSCSCTVLCSILCILLLAYSTFCWIM